MAIIIEHMEMPNGCCECRMQTENCCTLSLRPIDDIYDRPEWCLLAEAEPIVHCKDCRYYCPNLIDEVAGLPMCGAWAAPQKPEGYCNYGVIKDEAEV